MAAISVFQLLNCLFPFDAFTLVFLLFTSKNKFHKKLLEPFIAIVDAQLFKTVLTKHFKSINIQHWEKWKIKKKNLKFSPPIKRPFLLHCGTRMALFNRAKTQQNNRS